MTLRVTCAIIADGERVLCTQRGPAMSLPLMWEFPGGKVEVGESDEACIVREIAEELGLEIEILEQGPSVLHPLAHDRLLELVPFVCHVVGGTLCLREHAQARWCTSGEMEGLAWAEADLQILAWWRANGDRLQAAVARR